jgi:hypothetical protein
MIYTDIYAKKKEILYDEFILSPNLSSIDLHKLIKTRYNNEYYGITKLAIFYKCNVLNEKMLKYECLLDTKSLLKDEIDVSETYKGQMGDISIGKNCEVVFEIGKNSHEIFNEFFIPMNIPIRLVTNLRKEFTIKLELISFDKQVFESISMQTIEQEKKFYWENVDKYTRENGRIVHNVEKVYLDTLIRFKYKSIHIQNESYNEL